MTQIPYPKKLIEAAYTQTEVPLWSEDEAGPYQTIPYPGHHWRQVGEPSRYPHEYVRNGTAKQLTLFHPASGVVRVKGVRQTTNAILHPWLMAELEAVLAALPEPPTALDPVANRCRWQRWQEGLSNPFGLPEALPPLRMLLVLDNLQGHRTPSFVLWLIEHGIMPLYTPIGGSYMNVTESIQGILADRALAGQHPQTPEQIMGWLEATARGWNRHPTPFKWNGKRKLRRDRARGRRYALRGSGAYTERPLPRQRAA